VCKFSPQKCHWKNKIRINLFWMLDFVFFTQQSYGSTAINASLVNLFLSTLFISPACWPIFGKLVCCFVWFEKTNIGLHKTIINLGSMLAIWLLGCNDIGYSYDVNGYSFFPSNWWLFIFLALLHTLLLIFLLYFMLSNAIVCTRCFDVV